MEEINNFILQLLATITCGREKSCLAKRKYLDEEKAHERAQALSQRPNQRHKVEPYGCPWCFGWHVGRPLSRPRTLYLSMGVRGVKDGQDQALEGESDRSPQPEVPPSGCLGAGMVLQADGSG